MLTIFLIEMYKKLKLNDAVGEKNMRIYAHVVRVR